MSKILQKYLIFLQSPENIRFTYNDKGKSKHSLIVSTPYSPKAHPPAGGIYHRIDLTSVMIRIQIKAVHSKPHTHGYILAYRSSGQINTVVNTPCGGVCFGGVGGGYDYLSKRQEKLLKPRQSVHAEYRLFLEIVGKFIAVVLNLNHNPPNGRIPYDA
jgi:hypothetical protein